MGRVVFAVASLAVFLILSGNSFAQNCNKAEAQEVINMLVSGGMAERQDNPDSIIVWYIWKANWYGMSKEQQYKMISGLGGVEQCLKPGRAVRIRVAGKDVARASSTGKVELLD